MALPTWRWTVPLLLAVTGLLADPSSVAAAAETPAVNPPAPSAQPPATQTPETWHREMTRTPVPHAGCYTSRYPSTEWQEVPCTTAPAKPYPFAISPSAGGGAGGDFAAKVSSGSLSSATGSFSSVTGVTSESDPQGANHFALQLNANNFPTSFCTNQPANCSGWQQFIYSNNGCPSGTSCVFIQYWLINHTPSCPAQTVAGNTWTYFPGAPGQTPGCFINGHATQVPSQPIADLGALRLSGTSWGSLQMVTVETPAGPPGWALYHASDPNDFLGIGGKWTTAEFNVVGDCCGYQASFNLGSTITVQVLVDEGPSFVGSTSCAGGFTAESNNLKLIPPCFSFSNPEAYAIGIAFTEQFVLPIPGCFYPNAVTSCAAEPGGNIADDAYTATCPASSKLSMQMLQNGSWTSLPLHCSDGSSPGSCNAAASVANEFVLGTQKYGSTNSGADIGTTQTVQVCTNPLLCSSFQLVVTPCPSLPSSQDQFFLSQSPLQVVAGSAFAGNLVMSGPWVAQDLGNGAVGTKVDGTDPPSNINVYFPYPAEPNTEYRYGDLEVFALAPPSTTPGTYTATVSAQDVASNVAHQTKFPIQVLPCVPKNQCSVAGGTPLCGVGSNGCGGTLNCGSCTAGLTCSNSHCCGSEQFYNTLLNVCEPTTCPAGTSYCYDFGGCATDAQCQKAQHPYCEKVNGRLQCQ